MLTSRTTETVRLPNEPGEWIKVRMPSADIIADASEAGNDIRVSIAALQRCILEWSYKEEDGTAIPVTPENVADLDADTVQLLGNVLFPTHPDEERKNSLKRSMKP